MIQGLESEAGKINAKNYRKATQGWMLFLSCFVSHIEVMILLQ